MTGHQILKEKEIGRGKDYLLRCEVCSTVHEIQFRAPPLKRVPFMLTDGPESYMATIDLDADEWLELNDVFEHDEMAWRITRLESEKGSVEEIEASNLVRAVALVKICFGSKLRRLEENSQHLMYSSWKRVRLSKREHSLTLESRHGAFVRSTLVKGVHYEAQLMRPTSKECICMNHQDRNGSNQRRQENDVKRGKRVVSVSIRIQSCQKSKSRSGSSRQISARRKRPESDYGRFVQGIKNALAICNPMVGFSCSRRMLYSYHFSPYGM